MQDLVSFVLALAIVASPLIVSAQEGKEAPATAALPIHTTSHVPPQLMLRASYLLGDSEPKSASAPALKLEGSSSGVEVTPTEETQNKKERSPGAKAGIAIGVILGVSAVAVGVTAAALVSWSNSD